ncbi:GNAT family N-acetyltransferase [Lactobacillus delbrueckii]|uniref:GNAT family N-acetyltransferase n=1 Tax=Lactobacillus delbrueckii TaxID=1584 RepID=UPI0019D127E6|nr:GNAT family N-acetyltransferase [Lactobacillus delbrueckii]MBN6090651.1 N-acetyltransferase family protein [Lactobacillus delbrueckii subsp. bulgaricus]
MQLRTAEAGDAERLLEIYAPYVENTGITFEGEVPAVSEFEARITRTLKRYPYLVVLKVGQIVGYAHASPFKEQGAYAHSVELSIYVDANQCHQHIGRFHQCGYKFGRWYDMFWMEKMLGEHTVPAPAIIPFAEMKND